MIADIVYASNIILNKTGPFVTGSGSSIFVPPIFFRLGPTTAFTTGSGTEWDWKQFEYGWPKFALGPTNAFVTGSGTVYTPIDFYYVLGPTNPFVTGSNTVIEYADMIDFVPADRTNLFTTGSNVTLDLTDLQYEQLEPFIVGTTKMPAGKPYREIVIIS